MPFLAAAQQAYTGISYNTSLTLSDTRDYIDNYSWRGASMEYNQFINENVTVGFFAGWNVFYQKLEGEFTSGTRTASGTQQRYVNTLPILLESRYHVEPGNARAPYVGLGIGTMYKEQETRMGLFTVSDNGWQFALAPTVGFLLPIGSTAVNIGVRYNLGFGGGDLDDTSYLGINIGFAWMRY